ncbi:MAG: hypothetical protein JKX85_07035, partial [Phycisphaeraceae bacterium]|nr:hypothetical protein [Phycisphaeraceae bacterium]
MRLAFVLDEFPVLSETFILNQITGLIDRGLAPDLYALNRRGKDQAHEDVLSYGLLDQVTYSRALPAGKFSRIAQGMGLFAQCLLRSPLAALSAINPWQ